MEEGIRLAQSDSSDPADAVRELRERLLQPDTGLIIFFCSSNYDLDSVCREINRHFAGVPVVGCTTAGEIGPAGYLSRSLSGLSLPSDDFVAVSGRFDDLQQFDLEQGQAFVASLRGQLETLIPRATVDNTFAFQMIDGLSVREEPVTRAFQHALGRIPLLGGSAGDGESFRRTYVFSEGGFHEDSVVLVLATTTRPFSFFSTLHFLGTDERAVVTAANPATRMVMEINGLSAAEEYCRLVGVDMRELSPQVFAAHPVVVRVGGTDHARSIQKASPDGSLTFYCAIEEGIVLRAASRGDLVADLESVFDRLREDLGKPSAVLVCDCILRNLEITQMGLRERVAEIFQNNRAIGFATYGEQVRGIHVNQTLIGIAIGQAAESRG